MVKLSIVIPALNQEAPIGRAIQQFWSPGLASQIEVIVADAGSQDGTPAVARLLADRLLETPGLKVGWRSAAKNAGAAAAQGEVVIFVDPDARMLTSVDSMLERLQKLFGNGRRIVCAMPRVEAEEPGEVDLEDRSLLAVKRTAFLECGGFDEALDERENPELLERIGKLGLIEVVEEVHFSIQAAPKSELEEVAA